MNDLNVAKDADQFQSLLDTVERIRREKFPTLDSGVVSEILRLHADMGAGDVDLARAVEQVVDQYLSRGG
ncbi:MAG: hypothetical protein LC114_08780 [Bryobacterales bacterium]|jgi:hypothetical protein|nr:hypothetical protein [Bryobacterales bacterium]